MEGAETLWIVGAPQEGAREMLRPALPQNREKLWQLVGELCGELMNLGLENRVADVNTCAFVNREERSLSFIDALLRGVLHQVEPVVPYHYLAVHPNILLILDLPFVEFNYMAQLVLLLLVGSEHDGSL